MYIGSIYRQKGEQRLPCMHEPHTWKYSQKLQFLQTAGHIHSVVDRRHLNSTRHILAILTYPRFHRLTKGCAKDDTTKAAANRANDDDNGVVRVFKSIWIPTKIVPNHVLFLPLHQVRIYSDLCMYVYIYLLWSHPPQPPINNKLSYSPTAIRTTFKAITIQYFPLNETTTTRRPQQQQEQWWWCWYSGWIRRGATTLLHSPPIR